MKKLWNAFSKKERAAAIVAGCILVISLVWLGSIVVAKNTTVVPASGGEYREGMVGQPSYVNPILASSYADRSLVRLLFASLHDLADKVEMSSDKKSWRVRIKENVFWSDGERITSDDAIFTIQKIQDPSSNSPLAASWQGVTVQRVSQLEVQFTLATPYAFFENNLKDLFVLPKHLFAEIPPANWRLSEFNLKPIGSGPYTFVRYEKRDDGFITDYHLVASGQSPFPKPFIQDMDFAFFSKFDDAIHAFNVGQIDGIADIAASDRDTILRPHELLSFPLTTYYAAFFNQSTNLALQEPAIREALSDSVDRAHLVEDVFHGAADAVIGPLSPPLVALDSSTTTPNRNDLLVKLQKSGWVLDTDHILKKKLKNATISLVLELTYPHVPFLEQTANALKDAWETIGATVKLIPIAPGDELNTVIQNRKYQVLLFGNVVRDYGDLFPFWHSSERFAPGLNLSLLSSKDVDRLIESIRQDFDPTTRANDLQKLNTSIVGATPAVFLFAPRHLVVTTKDLGGVDVRPLDNPANRFRGTERWYLQTTRVLTPTPNK